MALKKKEIVLSHSSDDTVYVDEDNIVAAKRKIKTDLKNIIDDLNNIEKHYKTLRDHKDTKGTWKDVASSCVKKCNSYEKKMKNDRTALEDAVDDAVQNYVLTQIKNMKNAQSAADSMVG